MKKLLILSIVIAVLASCNNDSDTITDLDMELQQAITEAAPAGEGMDFFILPMSDEYSRIPQDPENPLTQEKIALGEELYHENCSGRKGQGRFGVNDFFMRELSPCESRFSGRNDAGNS